MKITLRVVGIMIGIFAAFIILICTPVGKGWSERYVTNILSFVEKTDNFLKPR